MASKAPAKKKKEKEAPPREQFMNTNDWPLYRDKELFRVKQVEDGKDEFYMVSSETDEVKIVSEAELLERFEPVKGLHKREF